MRIIRSIKGPVLVGMALVLGAIGLLIYESAIFLYPDQQALVLQFGEPRRILDEPGLSFKVPFIQNVKYFEKKILILDIPPEEVIASDQKRIVVDSLSRFRIKDPLEFYKTVGDRRIADSRLAGLVRSALRRILGTRDLVAVLSTERKELMQQITESVNKEALPFGVEVVDVRIKRVDLPEENSEAVYMRMQTEREREAKEIRALGKEMAQQIRAIADRKKEVIIAKAKEKGEIIRGGGDREAAAIYSDAAKRNPEFYTFYRTLEAYKVALTENGKDSTLILPHFFLDDLTGDLR